MKLSTSIRNRALVVVIMAALILAYPFIPRILHGQDTMDLPDTGAPTETESTTATPAEGQAAGCKVNLGGISDTMTMEGEEAADLGGPDGVDATGEQGGSAGVGVAGDTAAAGAVSADCPPEFVGMDSDGDGIEDCIDNCPFDSNSDQADANADGFGNMCEYEKTQMCAEGLLPADQCQ